MVVQGHSSNVVPNFLPTFAQVRGQSWRDFYMDVVCVFSEDSPHVAKGNPWMSECAGLSQHFSVSFRKLGSGKPLKSSWNVVSTLVQVNMGYISLLLLRSSLATFTMVGRQLRDMGKASILVTA